MTLHWIYATQNAFLSELLGPQHLCYHQHYLRPTRRSRLRGWRRTRLCASGRSNILRLSASSSSLIPPPAVAPSPSVRSDLARCCNDGDVWQEESVVRGLGDGDRDEPDGTSIVKRT